MAVPKDWSQLYLVGWYTRDGRPCVSSWDDKDFGRVMVSVVVLGLCDVSRIYKEPFPPLRDSIVPPGVTFELVPQGADAISYARRLGGVFAFGFYVPEGVARSDDDPDR